MPTLLLALWVIAGCATTLPPPASRESALMIGRVVVHDMRQGPPQSWSQITLFWQGPSQQIRMEAGHDGVFLLANLDAGEYSLTRLMLTRHTVVRGAQITENLSLALPLPWTVRVAPGAALAAGELLAEVRSDRTVRVSVTPLSPSARSVMVSRLVGTGWAERAVGIAEPTPQLAEPSQALEEGGSRFSGPDHVVLPYRGSARSIVVTAAINGRRNGRLLLDTGASVTVISRRLAREAEALVAAGAPRITLYTASGIVEAPVTMLASLAVGGVEVRQVPAAIHDLPGVGGEIDGLLGMSFLRHFKMTLDPDRGELTLDRR